MDDITRMFTKTVSYLYQNITFPRVSPEYSSQRLFPPVSEIGKSMVVRIFEILSTIHPNYYVVALCFVSLVLFIYIKIRYPFWNTQPVVHTYDYWRRWGTREGHIIHKLPYKSQFYDKESKVSTIDYSRVSTPEKQQIAVFLQSHYIPTDRLLSTLSVAVLDTYMSGHNAPSFVSVHREMDGHVIGGRHGHITNGGHGHITGTILSRLIHLYFSEASPTHIEAYFTEYMCIHRESGGGRVAERLFQTHEYNRRIRNPLIPVSLFRKEGALCEGVVPFIPYMVYTYYMRNLDITPLPSSFTISRVVKHNTDLVHDIYQTLINPGKLSMFSVCILPDIGNMLALLEKRELFLFCLKKGEHLYAIYIFRNAQIHYEELDGETLEFVASIQNTDNPRIFMSGFAHSLRDILKENRRYKMIRMSSIGHNQLILSKWREYHHSVLETPGALYLYNYVSPKMPVDTSRCFVVA
jgi:hypothetical protein